MCHQSQNEQIFSQIWYLIYSAPIWNRIWVHEICKSLHSLFIYILLCVPTFFKMGFCTFLWILVNPEYQSLRNDIPVLALTPGTHAFLALMQWLSISFPLQGLVFLCQVLLHPARSLQTFRGSQRPYSPPCCFSSSPSSRAQQICSDPHIVRTKPHIKLALLRPFHWAAAGIPLRGHSSVYMVWTHIWNKAGQSRIILRK